MREALQRVLDPCSVSMRAPISVLDLGLVTRIDVSDTNDVHVVLRTTSPSCMLVGQLLDAVEGVLRELPGIGAVTSSVDTRPGWTENAIAPQARDLLRTRRARSRVEVPVAPRQWEEAPHAAR